jgi:hypothetical protein
LTSDSPDIPMRSMRMVWKIQSERRPICRGNGDPQRNVEGFVCLNDRIAAQLMRVYLESGIRLPEDVRIVGIDDVSYASLPPVPLTTVTAAMPRHWRCRAGGHAGTDRQSACAGSRHSARW